MAIEYEAKVEVEDLDEIERRLRAIGAHIVDATEEEDIYIDLSPCIDMVSRDIALRIRIYRAATSDRGRYEVTYKGPRKTKDLKVRTEITVAIDDGHRLLEIFRELGFTKYITVYKRRKIYRYGVAKIFLDDVRDLGKFVEIEIENANSIEEFREMLAKILDTLNLPKQLISKSYLEMILEKHNPAPNR
ncbi:MAG: class IV adenylate cyclase [Ignisphaera sp.]|uniref:Class IV adenylate cyclase n=1 Tax=Ignisphaera aggregans TaxID=334771 RepID=A0A7J3JRP2_9CREN